VKKGVEGQNHQKKRSFPQLLIVFCLTTAYGSSDSLLIDPVRKTRRPVGIFPKDRASTF